MAWELKLVTSEQYLQLYDAGANVIGLCYTTPYHPSQDRWLSFDYLQKRRGQPIRYVCLPFDGSLFCLDHFCLDQDKKKHEWSMEGDLPIITLTPSINRKGSWHGFIRNGIISDDIEGRQA